MVPLRITDISELSVTGNEEETLEFYFFVAVDNIVVRLII